MNGRVAYFNLITVFQPGIANKLRRQANVAAREGVDIDFFWLPSQRHVDGHAVDGKSRLQVRPVRGRNALSIRYHQARAVNALSRGYDAVVLRYPQFDPVTALFLRGKSGITLEHHAKEPEELRLRGDRRWWIERACGGVFMSRFRALTAVTDEILRFQQARSGVAYGLVVPNGIDVLDTFIEESDVTSDVRLWNGESVMQFLFVASAFHRWHGLEEVLEAWARDASDSDVLHLVGSVTGPQRETAEKLPNVRCHGVCDAGSIAALYKSCQIALTSYRLDLKALTEASTLKTREYLLAGLPVFSGHGDSAFPPDFTYYRYQPRPDFVEMRQFVADHADTRRQDIREAAVPFIDAAVMTRKLHAFALRPEGCAGY
ncbi:MAG: hypothetical protein O7H39_01705 [Gammaproteobacteria bacterium]|nr:hypothetical protein [Gammaproteobacteria bacterium]